MDDFDSVIWYGLQSNYNIYLYTMRLYRQIAKIRNVRMKFTYILTETAFVFDRNDKYSSEPTNLWCLPPSQKQKKHPNQKGKPKPIIFAFLAPPGQEEAFKPTANTTHSISNPNK
jgi:hypothetical protein